MLRALAEANLADAAFDGHLHGDGGFSIRVVDVVVAVMPEAADADGADAALGVDAHADISGQADGGAAHSALDAHVHVLLPVSGEVGNDLARADFDFEALEAYAVQVQSALAGAHLEAQLADGVVVQAEIPAIVLVAEADVAALVLRDAEVAVEAGFIVRDFGMSFSFVVV